MDAVLEFVRTHAIAVAVVAACLLPAIYLTRKYSLPVIQWVIEYVIYCGVFHLLLCGVVKMIAWFRFESQMSFRDQDKVAVTWEIPVRQFWDRSLYDPKWLFWFEIVIFVAFIGLMMRFRPMKKQRVRERKTSASKGTSPYAGSGGQDLKRKAAELKGKKKQ